MSASLRKGWCPGALRPMPAKDGLLVRLRITGGILSAGTALALAGLAERCGNGLLDLSARGNLQMRGVYEATLGRLQDGLLALGLLDPDPAAEAVRNVMASPLAGLHGGLDIRPLVEALEARLVADSGLHRLPPKFGFLIDDGDRPNLANIEADIRFEWDGEGFRIGLGGDRDGAAQAGRCPADDLSSEAARIARVFLEKSAATPGISRMRELGAHVLRSGFRALPSPACGRRQPDEVGSDEGSSRFLNVALGGTAHHPTPADARATPDQVRGRLFSRKREKEGAHAVVGFRAFASPSRGANSVLGLAAPFGRLDAAMLRAAARLADAGGLGELRLTPWRVILVPGVSEAVDLPGFITDPLDACLSVAACVGSSGCAHATTDVPGDAARLASAFAPGAGIALHVSGCAKGCAKASPTEITLVARDGRYDIVRDGQAGDAPWRKSLDLAAVRETLRELA